jgi:hypothetical protein
VHRTLAIGPSDGRYVESTAPLAPATAEAGRSVTASYDLTGVTTVPPRARRCPPWATGTRPSARRPSVDGFGFRSKGPP